MGFRDEYSKFAGLMLDLFYQSRALDMETDFTEDGQVRAPASPCSGGRGVYSMASGLLRAGGAADGGGRGAVGQLHAVHQRLPV
jgi:hypothetical protein